jgi:copper chaperone
VSTATYSVTGMTCSHCVKAVEAELLAVSGVEDVNVELVPEGTTSVTVTSQQPLPVEVVRDALDEAGYHLVSG